MVYIVVVIPYPIYITRKNIAFPVVGRSGFNHINTEKIVSNIGAGISHGLYFPHFVLVLSAITPMIGSLIASHAVEINIINEHIAAGINITSVINADTNVATVALINCAVPLADAAQKKVNLASPMVSFTTLLCYDIY